jgi:hypothetical protein
MAKTSRAKGFEKLKDPEKYLVSGPGGATHQMVDSAQGSLTTNQGVIVGNNQNTLKSGKRGPSLLEDFAFREKITHLDHERIPERIVHARGSGAHGYFEVTNPIPHLTKASFLAEKGKKTEVFARFSTVAGGAGAGDMPRDVRGFAVLAHPVETAIGMEGERAEITPYRAPVDLGPSTALSLVGKAKPTLKGRKIGALVTDGADGDRVEALRAALEKEGAELAVVAPKIGGARPKSGKPLVVDMALSGAPSVFFDAVAIFASAEGIKPLLKNSAAIDWIRDAFGHLKVIGYTAAAKPLFVKAGVADDLDDGVVELDARASIGQYIETAKQQRVWDREARLAESDA